MPRTVFLGTVLVFALGASLIEPGVAHASPRQRSTDRQQKVTFPVLLPDAWGTLTALWARSGCLIDPHGCVVANSGGPVVGDNPAPAALMGPHVESE